MKTPIAMYLAQQLEDTHPSSSGIQLLMYNAAAELRRQNAAIEVLQAQVFTIRHNIAEFHADLVRADDAIKNMECALIESSNG